jgi:hypothetical protein
MKSLCSHCIHRERVIIEKQLEELIQLKLGELIQLELRELTQLRNLIQREIKPYKR